MKKINILVAVILALLMVFIFIGGSFFNIAFIYRSGLAVFLLLLTVILVLFQRLNAVKNAGKIEQAISPPDSQLQNLSPEKRAEIESFKKQLETAIASLKKSRIAKGKSGKSALYALPWYMIIGPSAAGKTTVIKNSGLEFPFSSDGLRGVGGTRNCDWFFSTRAIFLDTAGRYVTESEDKAEWQSFLSVLKKHRRKQPINGIIVALNIDEIITSDKTRLVEHASNIRQRINELLENLKVNFPVYVVFTKCDLIQGFIEYFGDLSETERSQIWGATLPFEPPDKISVKTSFDNEFELLLNKLFEVRTIRLSGPLKREMRRKVYLFPFQFKFLQTKLSFLISEIFQNNPYEENPVFRGFYFTSGTQEGIPLDIAIRDIAKQYNLPETISEETEEITETKNYFIKDFLNDIVIEDQNYNLGQTSDFIKKNNTLKLSIAGGSALFVALFSILAFIGYSGSNAVLDKIYLSAASFAQTNWNYNQPQNLYKADKLSGLIKTIRDGNAVETFTSFGMDRSERFAGLLEKLYFFKTSAFFSENIYKADESELRNFLSGAVEKNGNTYNYLKTYLLLGSQRGRLDEANEKYLSGMFTSILESRFPNDNAPRNAAAADTIKPYYQKYSAFITGYLKNPVIYHQENDTGLIDLVRSKMQYRPSAGELYSRLKQSAGSRLTNDVSFEQLVGQALSHIINSSSKIPYLYTADGWNNYVRDAVNYQVENSGREDWVMGNQQQKSQITKKDNDNTRREILLLYMNDFMQAWMQAIKNARYASFENVPLAAGSMKALSDPVNSPILTVLKTFVTQLQFITNLLPQKDTVKIKNALYVSPAGQNDYAFSNSAEPNSSQDMNNAADLGDIQKLKSFVLNADGSIGKDLASIIAQYGAISGALEQVKGGQDLTRDYAVKVLSQQAMELPLAQKTIEAAVYNTPALKDLFITPVRLVWRAILSDAASYINAVWKNKVVDPFNKTLANSFPFTKSNTDAPVQDFKEFFKPKDGVISGFVNNELSGFINKERWKVNEWQGEGLNISREAFSALKRADEISSTLFKNGELNFTFRLKPQLPDLKTINNNKPIVDEIFLSLNNVDNSYQMGAPAWTEYSWPGDKGVPGAKMKVSVRGYGSFETRAYQGEWALFRLLNDGTITSGGPPSQYRISWGYQKENLFNIQIIYLLNAEGTRNPFEPGFFRSFRLPDKIN